MKRRAFLAAAPAALVPVAPVAIAAAAEEPYKKLRRLGKEMADTLRTIQSHPIAPGSLVAFIVPTGEPGGMMSGTMDLDDYLDWQARMMTPEQTESIADWREKTAVCDKADAAYQAWCDSLPRGVHFTTAPDQTIRNAMMDASDAKWQAIHRVLRSFSSTFGQGAVDLPDMPT